MTVYKKCNSKEKKLHLSTVAHQHKNLKWQKLYNNLEKSNEDFTKIFMEDVFDRHNRKKIIKKYPAATKSITNYKKNLIK